jgi:hypothetical protein
LDSAIAALVGAAIGSMSSIATIYIQSKIRDRRDKLKQAYDLALEDYKIQIESARRSGVQTAVLPITAFVYHHLQVMNALERDELTPEKMREITTKSDKMFKLIQEIEDAYRRQDKRK